MQQLARVAERMREQLGGAVSDLLAAPFRDWEAALRSGFWSGALRLLSSQHDFADLVSAVRFPWRRHNLRRLAYGPAAGDVIR